MARKMGLHYDRIDVVTKDSLPDGKLYMVYHCGYSGSDCMDDHTMSMLSLTFVFAWMMIHTFYCFFC